LDWWKSRGHSGRGCEGGWEYDTWFPLSLKKTWNQGKVGEFVWSWKLSKY